MRKAFECLMLVSIEQRPKVCKLIHINISFSGKPKNTGGSSNISFLLTSLLNVRTRGKNRVEKKLHFFPGKRSTVGKAKPKQCCSCFRLESAVYYPDPASQPVYPGQAEQNGKIAYHHFRSTIIKQEERATTPATAGGGNANSRKAQLPDSTFRNFRVSQNVDRRILCSS